MTHHMAVGVTVLIVTASAPLSAPVIAYADPAVPQPGSQCAQTLNGAFTELPDNRTVLVCRSASGVGYQWQVFDGPYPNSEQWLSYGPKLTLHGEGQRNREINSGDWIAYPQDPATQCTANQLTVVSPGNLSPPALSTGKAGQPLKLRLLPLLFTIELSGYCLWQKAD